MQTLCPLQPWTENIATRGRGKGNAITSRRILGADNWNWVIGLERKGAKPVGENYFGCMRLLLPHLLTTAEFNFNENIPVIVSALETRTGQKVVIPAITNKDEAAAFGKLLDDTLNISYGRSYPPTVTQRLFGKADDDSETETDEAVDD